MVYEMLYLILSPLPNKKRYGGGEEGNILDVLEEFGTSQLNPKRNVTK